MRETTELGRRRIGGAVLIFLRTTWDDGETSWHVMSRVQYGEWPRERRGRSRTIHWGKNEKIAHECWRATIRACLAAREPKRRKRMMRAKVSP